VIAISYIVGNVLALTASGYGEKMSVMVVLMLGKDCDCRRSHLRHVTALPVTADLQQQVPPLREFHEV
jgi:hypothetical protein